MEDYKFDNICHRMLQVFNMKIKKKESVGKFGECTVHTNTQIKHMQKVFHFTECDNQKYPWDS